MQSEISLTRQTLLYLLQKVPTLFQRKGSIPEEAKAALRECRDMHDLLDLLFSTDFHNDQQFLSLFEKRIQELDASL